MAFLELKDVPNDIYEEILGIAERENRTLEQETLVVLERGLSSIKQVEKMQAISMEVSKMSLGDTSSFPSPESLIREDRDR